MKKKTTIEQVISELKALFQMGNGNNSKSIECSGSFYINKCEFDRLTVIHMLQNYFSDKFIDNGYLTVHGITLLYTTFEVVEGQP